MVEFAIVVVLLIALLYGIITYGLILAAQATVTQAAADGARAGIVAASTAIATAEAQAATDVGWMNKGTCGTVGHGTITCVATADPPARRTPTTSASGHGLLQLRLEPALPRAARAGRHHSVHDLVDQRPPDLDPELVGAA